MALRPEVSEYLEQHFDETLELLTELAQIPAPSNHEEQRAEFCRRLLESWGAEGVCVDDALNVIWPIGCEGDAPVTVFMAHSDVVFPDTTPLPLTVRDGRIYCPGVGDDTAGVTALLTAARYIAERKLRPRDGGVLLAVNSGEEGLGNLKGCRRIMEVYGSRVRQLVSFDAWNGEVTCRSAGSRRYRVTVAAEGGHSWLEFGKKNAVAVLSAIIGELYAAEAPEAGRNTWNVGTIRGGTSVNTIAQDAEALWEFRSDTRESLAAMEENLYRVIEKYRSSEVKITVEVVGDRPCMGGVDPERQERLAQRAAEAVRTYFGIEPKRKTGSTDCNIPLAMGIPAVAVGCHLGGGVHTREEYLEIGSLLPGLRLACDLVLEHFA